MESVYVVHYHEIALKGRNRPMFLRALQENICRVTKLPKKNVRIEEGRLIVVLNFASFHPNNISPWLDTSYFSSAVEKQLSHVFGVSSFSRAILVKAEYGEIERALNTSILDSMLVFNYKTFAIHATRGDKKFSMTSQELNVKLGAFVNGKFGKKVDLANPEITFYVEVFPGGALVYTQKIPGPGGLPVGTQPKVAVLLSGGIDSPVAAYRIMKRGAPIITIHFHSYPFTSRASIDKVKELAGVLARYGGPTKLYLVPLSEAQKAVVQNCAEPYRVLLYRRLMVRIAQELAHREGAKALVTGESLGQVASQTVENIGVTDAVATIPIFRPLIGYDKEEIIAEARRIGTYEISILPHDDCCTLMMPKNPATRARLADVEREESKVDVEKLIQAAIKQTICHLERSVASGEISHLPQDIRIPLGTV